MENYFLELISGFMFDALSMALPLFKRDKGPSIWLNAAGLCHFILGKLPRKKGEICSQ